MTIDLARPEIDRKTVSAAAIADGDIHPTFSRPGELLDWLPERWRRHAETYGGMPRHGYVAGPAYPKGVPEAMRRDAYPPGGGKAGGDLGFMQAQHLDPNNVALGILNMISPAAGAVQNVDYGAAMATAMNRYQRDVWLDAEPRLRGSIVVPYEDAAASVAEIERWAGDPGFAQVLLLSRTAEPLGQRRYWPILEAAAKAGLPVGIHAFGYGGYPVTGGGWPSYYIEEMVGHSQASQSVLTSLTLEGTFERFPGLRVVLIESGFAWLPSLAWRMDKHAERMRDELPHLRRRPSEYVREHVWLTTQPMEEPERPRDLRSVLEWIGPDRILFATDYPHWDFDDPSGSLPVRLDEATREAIMFGNARALYGG